MATCSPTAGRLRPREAPQTSCTEPMNRSRHGSRPTDGLSVAGTWRTSLKGLRVRHAPSPVILAGPTSLIARGATLPVAVDPHGRLHHGKDHAGGDHIVVGEQVPDAYLAELREDGVSYLFAGPDGHDLHR